LLFTFAKILMKKLTFAKVRLIRQPKAATFSNTLRFASLEKA